MNNREYKISMEYDNRTECYVVLINGVTILECVSLDEVKECSIGELIGFYEEAERM